MCVFIGPRRRYNVTPLVLGQFSVQLFFFSIIIYASTEKKPVVAVQNPPVLLYDCVSRVVGGPAVVAGGEKQAKKTNPPIRKRVCGVGEKETYEEEESNHIQEMIA